MAHLTSSLHLFFFQCANYCRERGKRIIYCILVQQTAKSKIIWKEIMFLMNSKSDKRCKKQGSTILFPEDSQAPDGHTVLYSEWWTFASLPFCSCSCYPCALRLWICPALLPLSFKTFLPSWSSKQASSSFPSDPTSFTAHPVALV